MPHPDIRTKKQLTVKVTEQFAKDMNLVLASYGLTDVSYVIRQSVAAQANGIREGMAARQAASEEPVKHAPGKAILCTQCKADGFTVCQEV